MPPHYRHFSCKKFFQKHPSHPAWRTRHSDETRGKERLSGAWQNHLNHVRAIFIGRNEPRPKSMPTRQEKTSVARTVCARDFSAAPTQTIVRQQPRWVWGTTIEWRNRFLTMIPFFDMRSFLQINRVSRAYLAHVLAALTKPLARRLCGPMSLILSAVLPITDLLKVAAMNCLTLCHDLCPACEFITSYREARRARYPPGQYLIFRLPDEWRL